MRQKKNLSAMMRKHKQGGMLGSLMATQVAPKLAHLALDGISGLISRRKGKRGRGIKRIGARGGAIKMMGAMAHTHHSKKRGKGYAKNLAKALFSRGKQALKSFVKRKFDEQVQKTMNDPERVIRGAKKLYGLAKGVHREAKGGSGFQHRPKRLNRTMKTVGTGGVGVPSHNLPAQIIMTRAIKQRKPVKKASLRSLKMLH